MPNLVAVSQMVRVNVGLYEIRRKTRLLASRLSGSLKVIGTDTDRPFPTYSKDIDRKQRIFLNPRLFNASIQGVSLGFT